jgi:HEAT repeat protein
MIVRTLVLTLLAGSLITAEQPQNPAAVRPEVLDPAEARLLAEGWAALAGGDLERAAARVSQLRAANPRDAHSLLLGVEIDLARAGARAALNGYEAWLGGRTLDYPSALRRIARGFLFESSRGRDALARLEALNTLAAEGDPAAQEALVAAAATGSLSEVRLLASSGHVQAVERLIEALGGPVGNKIALIEALVKSGSRQVVAPLTAMLRDPRPEHRAAAAEGLGRLGARDQLAALKTLLTSPASTLVEQVAAAGALLRLDDNSGRPQLERWLQSEVPDVRIAAARALAIRHDQTWLSVVRQLSRDSDPLVRLDAVTLLAPYDRDLALGAVQRLMSDENVAVREQAVRVFAGQLAGDFGTLRQLLKSADGLTRSVAATRVLELTR